MPTMTLPPLLVTGLPRSGTSWTGKMLEASGEVVYVNEPMSMRRPPGGSPGVLDARVEHWFHYIDPHDDEVWRSAFRDTLRLRFRPVRELRSVRKPYHLARAAKYATEFMVGAVRGRRAMLDDPNAIYSSRWLHDRMGVRVVYLVRDPVGMIGSWRQLGWRPRLEEILAQPALLRDHMASERDEIEGAIATGDWLIQMCCLWNVGNRFIDAARRELDAVAVWRYDDLANDPLDQYEQLYAFCGLTWSPDARDAIREATTASTDAHRGFAWTLRGGVSRTAFRRMDSRASVNRADTRLAPDEIALVRERTADVLSLFPRTTS
jgi:hypothetical protein